MSNYLIHYGIKGMKWGKHKYATYDDVVRTSRDAGRAQERNAMANERELESVRKANDAAKRLIRNSTTHVTRPNENERDWRHMNYNAMNRVGNYYEAENAMKEAHDAAVRSSHDDFTKRKIAERAKKNYDSGLGKKAAEYAQQRANTKTRQQLAAEQVKASRDMGRAQSKTAALNASNGYFNKDNPSEAANNLYLRRDGYQVGDDYQKQALAILASSAMAQVKSSNVTSKIASYDAKTQNNVKKITSGKTTVSQVATNVVSKGKALLNSIFGKKKGK